MGLLEIHASKGTSLLGSRLPNRCLSLKTSLIFRWHRTLFSPKMAGLALYLLKLMERSDIVDRPPYHTASRCSSPSLAVVLSEVRFAVQVVFRSVCREAALAQSWCCWRLG